MVIDLNPDQSFTFAGRLNMFYSLLRISAFFTVINLVIPFFISCKEKPGDPASPKVSFYFWKTKFSLNEEKKAVLDSVSNGPLFTRFFDIIFDPSRGKIVPVAILNVEQSIDRSVVPVIFIKQQVFQHISANDSLEVKVLKLIESIAGKYKLSLSEEIQLDCDWTESTRDNYFRFLKTLKATSGTKISCTIRLHQVKFAKITGIPPVDRGVLMFYNMGSLKEPGEGYIFNEEAAGLYVSYLSAYPLQLDLALPYYSHLIHSRNNKVINILPLSSEGRLLKRLRNERDHYYADSSFFIDGLYCKKGDQFKCEKAGVDITLRAAAISSGYLKGKVNNLLLYEINNASEADVEEILSLPSYFN